MLTKSASIRSCSGENDAASTLPRMIARYANSSSRVFGKPPTSSSALPTSSRQVLVLGRALQDDDLQVLVVLDRAADELHLEPRLAFEVEDLLAPVVHLDERVARVVLRDLLAVLRRHSGTGTAAAPASAAVKRTRTVADSPSARQRDVLRADDAAVVFDLQRHRLRRRSRSADSTTSTTSDVPLSVDARRLDARDLDVAREALLADADGEHRNRPRLEAGERLVERGVRRVGAVGDHHQPGERQARPARRARARAPAPRRVDVPSYFRSRGVASAIGRRREAEEAQDEPLRQRLRAAARSGRRAAPGRTSLRGWPSRSAIVMLRESSIRTPRKFCCGTAALQDQRRPEQAEERARASDAEPQRRRARARSRGGAFGRDAPVGEQRGDGERREPPATISHRPGGTDPRRNRPARRTDARILEEEAEEAIASPERSFYRDRPRLSRNPSGLFSRAPGEPQGTRGLRRFAGHDGQVSTGASSGVRRVSKSGSAWWDDRSDPRTLS